LKHIPNFLTCMNLLSGCFAIVFALQGNLIIASRLVFVAGCFDFADGMAARLFNYISPIGKELDSLADVVSFGVVPGVIVYKLMQAGLQTMPFDERIAHCLPFLAFIIPIFSALRLAKFNIDERQTDKFIGVPTPANAMLIASLPLIIAIDKYKISPYFENPWFLIALSVIMSGLLVSELPLFSLKFKNISWQDNKIRFIFVAISLALFIILHITAVPFIVLLYIVLSIINNRVNFSKVLNF